MDKRKRSTSWIENLRNRCIQKQCTTFEKKTIVRFLSNKVAMSHAFYHVSSMCLLNRWQSPKPSREPFRGLSTQYWFGFATCVNYCSCFNKEKNFSTDGTLPDKHLTQDRPNLATSVADEHRGAFQQQLKSQILLRSRSFYYLFPWSLTSDIDMVYVVAIFSSQCLYPNFRLWITTF